MPKRSNKLFYGTHIVMSENYFAPARVTFIGKFIYFELAMLPILCHDVNFILNSANWAITAHRCSREIIKIIRSSEWGANKCNLYTRESCISIGCRNGVFHSAVIIIKGEIHLFNDAIPYLSETQGHAALLCSWALKIRIYIFFYI